VALNAGVYLLARLNMHVLAELDVGELFDVDRVEVKGGIIRPGRAPTNRFFVWHDPAGRRDLVVFVGEAQPPAGKYALCRRIVSYAREIGVERAFTFAAMSTRMHPEHPSRVFAAATDWAGLEELERFETLPLEDGHVGGLNGVLVAVAAEAGLRGACLLGEMPHVFHQVPFPKASLAILEVFTALMGVEVDFTDLAEQARETELRLGEILARVERQLGPPHPEEEEEAEPAPEPPEGRLGRADERRIEGLFAQAAADRSRAFELKQELDRLGVFAEYEDRFLDLFRRAGDGGASEAESA
jgi:proteasome assembly chaperone (PAC2) family protein